MEQRVPKEAKAGRAMSGLMASLALKGVRAIKEMSASQAHKGTKA